MPEFEANMNYIPQGPPSFMKQCNKSATVKFHMELLLTTTTCKQSCSCASNLAVVRHLLPFAAIFKPEERPFLPGSSAFGSPRSILRIKPRMYADGLLPEATTTTPITT